MSFEYAFHESILKVENVSLQLGGNPILKNVDFQIKNIVRKDAIAGQVIALLGPSGIGKTQLFRILAGLNHPDSGQVLIGDPGKPVEKGMIGVVAQHYPLFEHRTVLSNLLIAGGQSGRAPEQTSERARGLLDRFKLQDRADAYPAQLSGGQRQRVAIAQQIMCSESFLLMDEPFSGLDLVALHKVQQLINEIACTNELNTIIMVTHDIVSALEIADTLLLLGRDCDEKGKLLPGARIQAQYNLIDRGLTWRPDITSLPAFTETLKEVRDRFPLL